MRSFLLVFFVLASSYSTAQREAAIWYFGENAGLDFNTGNPVVLTDGQMRTREGCSSISDAAGNLLFYTDGEEIWNRNHQVMPNGGDMLGGFSSTQSSLVIPRPGSTTEYYVFTVDQDIGPDGLRYSILDMNLDGGLGDITGTKNILINTPVIEKLTAIEHANGQDYWILTHGWGNNRFFAYRVTAAGVDTTPVITDIGTVIEALPEHNGGSQHTGYLKFSPDGTKVASASFRVAIDLFDFDAATGVLSNFRVIEDQINVGYYGIEFSPNSRYLYAGFRTFLYQYDTQAANVSGSRVLVHDFNGADGAGGMQLAIDGKIYVTHETQPFISHIENPDEFGMASNFVYQSIDLLGGISRIGLPQFIQSFFLVSFTAENLCLGETTQFTLNVTDPITSVLWDFGDGATSTLENPTHIYATPGTYTVQVTVQTTSELKTETRDITITETPIANTVMDIDECHLPGTYSLDLTGLDNQVLGTQTASEHRISYHPTQSDAEMGTLAINSPYTPIGIPETLFVRIESSANPNCFATTSFTISIKDAPELFTASNWIVCDTDSDGLFNFDLSTKDTEILGGQSPTDFGIIYYATQADADARVNALPSNYTNTNPSETIFYRIENSTYPECYETGSFQIEVVLGVEANNPGEFALCDSDNDGFEEFDLSSQDLAILGTQDPSSFTVTYHQTQADAESGSAILPTMFTNQTAYTQTLYARVSNTGNPDCYNTTPITLAVYDSPEIGEVSPWLICDMANDGVETIELGLKTSEILGDQPATSFEVHYYQSFDDANNDVNTIGATYQNTAITENIYYRIGNSNNPACYVIGDFEIELLAEPVANTPAEWVRCDLNETGSLEWDLSELNADILGNQNPANFQISYHITELDALSGSMEVSASTYVNQNTSETLWARVTNSRLSSCYATTPVALRINSLPNPLLGEQYVICPDSPELILDGGEFESWNWQLEGSTISNERILDVETIGNYSLTVSETSLGVQCEKTITFEVVSSGAPETVSVEVGSISDQVEVLVLATGIGQFEYSIDGTTWQDSNRFTVFPGSYTMYVRDPFECRVLSEPVMAIGYSRFFTPNGDNTNETWHIIGAQEFPDSRLQIFDRYGQLMASLSPDDSGWDGRVSGRLAPPSDYWFRYEYGEGEVLQGHFTLKR